MIVFDTIADIYDAEIANGRFDYERVVAVLLACGVTNPISMADLASGTGSMAYALGMQWPQARLTCEEPSYAMMVECKRKLPGARVVQRKLQKTEIRDQDLITVVFNSINYVPPEELSTVFERVSRGLRASGVFYIDALTQESALELLAGKEMIEKVQIHQELKVHKQLTPERLTHIFQRNNGSSEEHIQYLLPKQAYLSFLESAGLTLIMAASIEGTMRTEIVCKKV